MAQITVNDTLSRVNKQLNDPGYVRWTKAELLDYLNDAQRAIALRRPDACCVDKDDFECVAGTKQTLPVDGLRLADVPRNASGRSIRGPFNKLVLDGQYPDWYAGNTAAAAELYIYDQRNPKTFYLYPGVVEGTQITLVYFSAPSAVSQLEADSGATISLDDVFANALIEWILYRCYTKDAEYAANGDKAILHLNGFKAQLGEKNEADAATASQAIKE